MKEQEHSELCKQFCFNHVSKWYQPKPESVVENKNIIWDFKIHIDHPNEVKKPRVVVVNKERQAARLQMRLCQQIARGQNLGNTRALTRYCKNYGK